MVVLPQERHRGHAHRLLEAFEARAVDSGAKAGTIKVVEVEDLPLSYVSGNTRRIRVRAVGDLA